MRRMMALLVGLGSAGLIAACGNTGGGNGLTVVSGGITYFIVRGTLNQDTVSVPFGIQTQLHGVTYDAGFNVLALVGDTVWTSRNTGVATVDTHGLVTTIVAGTTWVVGTFTPKSSQQSFADSVLIQAFGPT